MRPDLFIFYIFLLNSSFVHVIFKNGEKEKEINFWDLLKAIGPYDCFEILFKIYLIW